MVICINTISHRIDVELGVYNMALLSPGVQVTVTDKSIYLPAAETTVPLFFIATKYGKLLPNSNTVAQGTIEAGVPRLITSLRDSIESYGIPVFYRDVYDQPHHGDCRNEYGLLALNQFLKLGNRAYVIRADIDLDDNIESLQDKWGLATDRVVNSAAAMFSAYLASVDDIISDSVTTLGGFVEPPAIPPNATTAQILALTDAYYANVTRAHDENVKLAHIVKAATVELIKETSTFGNKFPNSTMYNISDILAGNYVNVETEIVQNDVGGKTHTVYVYEPYTENTDPVVTGKDSYYNLLVSSGARKVLAQAPTAASLINPLPIEPDLSQLFVGITGKLQRALIDQNTLIGGTVVKYDAPTLAAKFTTLPTDITFQTTGSDNFVITGNITGIVPQVDAVTKAVISYKCRTDFTIAGNVLKTIAGATPVIYKGTIAGKASGYINYVPASGSGASAVASTAKLMNNVIFDLTLSVSGVSTAVSYTLEATADFDHIFVPITSGAMTYTIDPAALTNFTFAPALPTGVTLNNTLTSKCIITGKIIKAVPYLDTNSNTLYHLHTRFELAGNVTQVVGTTTTTGTLNSTGYSYAIVNYDPVTKTCTLESTFDIDASLVLGTATGVAQKITVTPSVANPVTLLHTVNAADTVVLGTPAVSINVANKSKVGYTAVNPLGGIDLNLFKAIVREGCEEYLKTYSWYNSTHPKGKAVTTSTADAVRRQGIVLKLSQIIKANTTVNYNISSDFDDVSDITSEAYEFNTILCPGFPELADEMLELADRVKQEAFVIADTPYWMSPRDVIQWGRSVDESTVVSAAANIRSDNGGKIAYYYPHGLVANLDGYDVFCAASGLALAAFAYTDKNGNIWDAPAGPNRGVVSSYLGVTRVGYVTQANLGTSSAQFNRVRLNDGMRDSLYSLCNINPIQDSIQNGIAIWGQKTRVSVNFNSALDRINVSRMVMHIRRMVRKMLVQYLMQPNVAVTRKNVTSLVVGFLNNIRVNNGLYDFAVLCDESNNTADRIDRNELYVEIALKPVKTIEFIYVPMSLVKTGDSITS
jgi:hypothetical protein